MGRTPLFDGITLCLSSVLRWSVVTFPFITLIGEWRKCRRMCSRRTIRHNDWPSREGIVLFRAIRSFDTCIRLLCSLNISGLQIIEWRTTPITGVYVVVGSPWEVCNTRTISFLTVYGQLLLYFISVQDRVCVNFSCRYLNFHRLINQGLVFFPEVQRLSNTL